MKQDVRKSMLTESRSN